MSGTPTKPDERIDEETEKTVRDRLATFDDDVKTATDARQAVSEIRKNLKTPQPR